MLRITSEDCLIFVTQRAWNTRYYCLWNFHQFAVQPHSCILCGPLSIPCSCSVFTFLKTQHVGFFGLQSWAIVSCYHFEGKSISCGFLWVAFVSINNQQARCLNCNCTKWVCYLHSRYLQFKESIGLLKWYLFWISKQNI